MNTRERMREQERAKRWVRDLVRIHGRARLFELGDELVLGSFDWRDWFDAKPSSVFLDAVDSERMYLEEVGQ